MMNTENLYGIFCLSLIGELANFSGLVKSLLDLLTIESMDSIYISQTDLKYRTLETVLLPVICFQMNSIYKKQVNGRLLILQPAGGFHMQLLFHDLNHQPCTQLEAVLKQHQLRQRLILQYTLQISVE